MSARRCDSADGPRDAIKVKLLRRAREQVEICVWLIKKLAFLSRIPPSLSLANLFASSTEPFLHSGACFRFSSPSLFVCRPFSGACLDLYALEETLLPPPSTSF